MKAFVPPSSLITSDNWLLVPRPHQYPKVEDDTKLTSSIDHQLDWGSSIHALDGGVDAAILIFVRERHCRETLTDAQTFVMKSRQDFELGKHSTFARSRESGRRGVAPASRPTQAFCPATAHTAAAKRQFLHIPWVIPR
jgi:hypothetical protein